MASIVFDTHTYIKKLKAVGFTEEQAETQAEALTELVDKQLVTREYLDLRLAELKTDLIKWVLGVAATQAALIVALIKIL